MTVPDTQKAILIDFWYGPKIATPTTQFEDFIKQRFNDNTCKIILKNNVLRSLAFLWASRNFSVVMPEWNLYGRTFCIFQALRGKRNVVLLECIDYANLNKSNARAKILKFLTKSFFRPAMSRSVLAMQTMTENERAQFSDRYGVARERIVSIKWPLHYYPIVPEPREVSGLPDRYVFSSGRSSCDWPTVISASRLGNWPLLIVCAGKDLELVNTLNSDGHAIVLSDIPESHHNYLMSKAQVNVISLQEKGTSTGHIRLGTSIALNVATVATAVEGLSEYIDHGVNGLSVPVEDPAAMAKAVSDLLNDDPRRLELTRSAYEACRTLDQKDYFQKIDVFVQAAFAKASR